MNALQTPITPNISINYFGFFTPFSGYGIANFSWVKHLIRAGVNVFPHGKFMPVKGSKEYVILNEEERKIVEIPFKKQRIGIIETTPFDFETINTEIKIANTMAENDTMGKPWVNACNSMDFCLVPNKFQKDVFINSGVKEEKVRIIPHGTETEKFPYVNRPERDVFTFGIVGYLNGTADTEGRKLDRKGVFDVIQSFTSEFSPDEKVRLILKTSNPAFGYYSLFTDKRIHTINKLYDTVELNKLYSELDCFVFPSKAEGIGQPPREAMACFVPETQISLNTEIEKIHKRKFRGNLLIIKSGKNKVKSTPNHPFLTNRGWVLAKDLTIGDYIYILTNNERNILDKGRVGDIEKEISDNESIRAYGFIKQNKRSDTLSNSKIAVTSKLWSFSETFVSFINSIRNVLFSWLNGWGRNFYFQRGQKAQQNYSVYTNIQYGFKNNKFYENKNRTKKLLSSKRKEASKEKNSVYLLLKRIINYFYPKNFRTLSLNQKKTLWNFDFFYRGTAKSQSQKSELFRKREELLKTDKGFKYQRVNRITSEYYNGFVYNLTTLDGIYFANGFLVHNCGLPVIVGNYSGLEEIANPDFSYPISPSGFFKRKGWVEQPGNWATYDISELMYLMRYIYEHKTEAKKKGKVAAKEIRKNHSWEGAAVKMKEFLLTL